MTDSAHISLSLLNKLIREVVEDNFLDDVWIVAEISDVKSASSGHCYLELVEKKNDKIIARIKANIWSFQYQKIASEFYSVTGKQLEKGMQILLLVGVSFHELYGISLVVKNINPTFTLGELERKRKEIIARLDREGLMQLNKNLELELVPKRIAVISSENAAGYEDFVNQIKSNAKGYCLEITLFQAVMQGDKTESSFLSALATIQAQLQNFDSLAIIRGGGASLDLAAFDSYNLAKAIAEFPLPVVSGIGHERDFTVVDYVVHTRLKTPTAVAEFYLQQFEEFEEYVVGLKEALVYLTRDLLSKEKNKSQKYRSNFALLCHSYVKTKDEKINRLGTQLNSSTNYLLSKSNRQIIQFKKEIGSLPKYTIKEQKQSLNRKLESIKSGVARLLENQEKELKSLQQSVKLMDPINVLNRGYALVYNKDQKIIKSTKELSINESLTLQLKDGKVKGKIESL